MEKNNSRTLGYKSASLIEDDDLATISGGGASGTTVFTTKQSVDRNGNWDITGDVQWD